MIDKPGLVALDDVQPGFHDRADRKRVRDIRRLMSAQNSISAVASNIMVFLYY
jgi:hypothetical protein